MHYSGRPIGNLFNTNRLDSLMELLFRIESFVLFCFFKILNRLTLQSLFQSPLEENNFISVEKYFLLINLSCNS